MGPPRPSQRLLVARQAGDSQDPSWLLSREIRGYAPLRRGAVKKQILILHLGPRDQDEPVFLAGHSGGFLVRQETTKSERLQEVIRRARAHPEANAHRPYRAAFRTQAPSRSKKKPAEQGFLRVWKVQP